VGKERLTADPDKGGWSLRKKEERVPAPSLKRTQGGED